MLLQEAGPIARADALTRLAPMPVDRRAAIVLAKSQLTVGK